MAFKVLRVLPLLALVHAEPAGKAYDEYFRRWKKMLEPGGLDAVLELVEPGATAVVNDGPKTETKDLREYFSENRDSIEELSAFDVTNDILKVSGPTVTTSFSQFGVFKSGCQWTTQGFGAVDFNEAGKVTFLVSISQGMETFMACYKGEKQPPVGDVVPGPKMPRGYWEYRRAQDDIREEGGVDRYLDRMSPEGKIHITMGEKLQESAIREFFDGYRSVIGKTAVVESYWQPLLKQKNAIFQTVSNVAVFKDGCVAHFGGYWFFAMNDEGKIEYMWQHVDDTTPFVECAAQELAVSAPAFGGSASVAVTAFVGAVVGAAVSLAAMAALFAGRSTKPVTTPLLQDSRGA